LGYGDLALGIDRAEPEAGIGSFSTGGGPVVRFRGPALLPFRRSLLICHRARSDEISSVASPTQIDPTISLGTHFSGLGDAGVKIYVGNLSFETTESEVSELFGSHGEGDEVTLITDRDSGRPRGFGFVQMGNEQAARNAINALDGQDVGGRQLKVNEARARN